MSRPRREAKKPERYRDDEEHLPSRSRSVSSVVPTTATESVSDDSQQQHQASLSLPMSEPTESVPTTSAAAASSRHRGQKRKSKETGKKGKTPGKAAKKQQKKTAKVGKAKALSRAEIDALLKNKEERDTHVDDLVADLTGEEAKDILAKICKENPCYLLDLMQMHQVQGPSKPPTPEPPSQPHWCVCGNCRIMSSVIEDVCCRQTPELCISRTPQMQALCLDENVLHLSMLYRADVLAIQNYTGDNQREKNKSLRFAGYRQYVLWQHGRLGYGVRRVIPSCCVWKIRTTSPDESGQYVPFRPGLF